jgi:hypothetical protein
VVVHLVALCLVVERGQTPEAAVAAMRHQLAALKARFPFLDPPADMGATTVVEVAAARSLAAAVEDWARSAWSAWAHQHGYVHGLVS